MKKALLLIGLLLAITRQFHCTASRALQYSGVALEAIQNEIANRRRQSAGPKGNDPETLDRLLKLAAVEAADLHHQHVGTGHFLLALLRDGQSRPGEILRKLGLSLPTATKAVLKELEPHRSN